ncbi:uncharacterized protein LOC122787704 isoform X1 [Protopterus annectens]|uniref:uncharacterized protein LOC122787704 isoform X1 n=1 Tax=Protopterus annectens TaxID=7888 RepID=UPI001CFBFD1E|nr:uncharacterized protein LOC122787704 isoform X1 [Protopterus annectens]
MESKRCNNVSFLKLRMSTSCLQLYCLLHMWAISPGLHEGYIRVLLLLSATWFFDNPLLFIPCYVSSVILDGVDGYAARKLKQVSEFGAWFDVVIDILGRGILWSILFRWGYFIAALEWCVFVCTHNSLGADWKNKFGSSPWWVQRVMANGFKTPVGFFAIAGLHVLPIWLYGYTHGVLKDALCMPHHFQWLGILLLCAGRILCMSVEVWCIWNHIQLLTEKDDNVNKRVTS